MAQSRKIETHEDLINVVSASMEDSVHGKTIADAVAQVGADGFIKIEESNDFGVHTEVIPGMQFDGVELAGAFMRSEVNDPVVLVTNAKITAPNELIPAVQLINTQTLVVIAQGYERDVVSALYHAAGKNGNNIIALKAPALTDEELEDVATYTKSVFLNEKTGLSISKVKVESFGTCSRVVVNKTGLAIIGGQGDTTARLEAVRAELETEKREQFTRRLNKRLGRLSGGVMIVYVGAQTDTEKRYLKLKVEDAVNAAQGALKEGVVHGGGMALFKIAGELSEDNMLKIPITAPYTAIQDNAGTRFDVPETVLDPVIVTRTALEAAVSVARTLVTADYIIVEEEDTAAKMLVDTLTQTK
jgi:chaperonin GroEL